jgi:triacylglycerol esterase/lipase EstA (alpha/beta hydrolase family)
MCDYEAKYHLIDDGDDVVKLYTPNNPLTVDVVILMNGTDATVNDYEHLATFLASHCYFVIDNFNSTTGDGKNGVTLFRNVKDILAQQGTHIYSYSMIGHSQGATGAINALTKYDIDQGEFKTLITVALPHEIFASQPAHKISPEKLHLPSMLQLTGGDDFIISSYHWNKEVQEKASSTINHSLVAKRKKVGHNEIQKENSKYFSIILNWLNYKVRQEAQAQAFFESPDSELKDSNKWKTKEIK